MADYSITEHIPVADHVYKYLIKKCGSDHYTATRSDFIGNLILSSLGRHPDIKTTDHNFKKIFNVTIKEESYLRSGIYLGIKSGLVFNKMIDKMFREELYTHAIISKETKNHLHLKSMRSFLKVYNITEDEIQLDTLYRDFKRKKDDIITT